MTWDFDEIPKYVINLDRRSDRWIAFSSASGIPELKNLRRWSATDGKTINLDTDNRVSLFTKYNITRGKRRAHREVSTKGAIGCYVSHVEIWKDFLEKSNSEVGIIFEDDVIIDSAGIQRIKEFIQNSDTMKEPDLWDFCILSPHRGSKKHGSMYASDPHCLRLLDFFGTAAVLFTKKGIKKVMPLVYPIEGQIDGFLSVCSQLQLLNIGTPKTSLLRIRYSPTDIQRFQDCEICDIDTDYRKFNEIVPLWRMRMLQFEEIVVVMGVLFIGGYYIKKQYF